MSGLLQRGLTFLSHSRRDGEEGVDELDLAETEGISKEDQEDIRAQIEEVASRNRISVSPELFSYRALKKGAVFPILINLIAILVLGGGLTLMAYLFGRSENRITGQDAKITSAEGEILQEVKREATQQIQQKNQEIASIQDRLQQIDSEKTQLQQNMDSRVQARETELKAQMDAALATERARLQGQGVSQAEINRQLNALQSAQTAQFSSQMDQFRQQAEAERTKLATNLQNLETEYQSNLAKATADRAKILDDSQKRITDLQTQLQGQINQSQQQLSQAQTQLQALQETSQKQLLAASQITGFYTTVRDDVNKNDYSAALATLSSLQDYLSSDAVLQLSSIRERRPAELFIISSLTTLIQQQSQQNSQNSQSLIAAASIVDQARSLAAQAGVMLKQDNTQAAAEMYRKALALVPGIAASHQYFVDLDAAQVSDLKKQVSDLELQQKRLTTERADIAGQLQAELARNRANVQKATADQASRQAAQSKLENALDQARRLYAAGRYQESIDQYRLALSYLPVGDTLVGTSVQQIADAGYQVQSSATVTAASDQAAPILRRAQELAAGGKFQEAIDAYAQLIRSYPFASQLPAALAGMRGAYASQMSSLQNQIASLTQERDRLSAQSRSAAGTNSEISTLTAENKRLTGQVASLQGQIQSLQQERTSLSDKLGQTEKELAAARNTGGSASAAANGSQSGGQLLDASTQQELAQLRQVDAQYRALQNSYRSYAGSEDALLGPPPPATDANAPLPAQASLLKSKVLLDKFLSSDQMKALFPGLLDRVRQYDRGFEASGRATAVSQLTDLVYNLSQLSSASDRKTLIDQQLGRTSNPDMQSFLRELGTLVGGS
ncbi:MAG TPA: hypothetical protein VMW87_03610 [Spirochaetia bacterium]|nr:hypothetical protein [Spirochaetia bacterium]